MQNKELKILTTGIYVSNKLFPVYCYESPPKNTRLAKTTDLRIGWIILYEVLLGPDKGKYYTDIITAKNYHIIIDRINSGHKVYIGDIPIKPIDIEETKNEEGTQ